MGDIFMNSAVTVDAAIVDYVIYECLLERTNLLVFLASGW